MKVERLPSGNYRVRAWYTDGEGKSRCRSFTHSDKTQAMFLANDFLANHRDETDVNKMTFKVAMEKYIGSKRNLLSPATVRVYTQTCNTTPLLLSHLLVDKVRAVDIQRATNEISINRSPKTVRNYHGFWVAVMKMFRPQFAVVSTLPQRKEHQMHIPSREQMKKLREATTMTIMELPVLLAAYCGLRRSEICALEWDDIDFENKTITISKALVIGEESGWTSKSPKSAAGYRTVEATDAVIEALRGEKAKGKHKPVAVSPSTITGTFIDIRDAIGMHDIRFHDLRHFFASMLLVAGVPDKYGMELMGHKSNYTYKQVYQHTISSEASRASAAVNKLFDAMETDTKTDTTPEKASRHNKQ